MLAAILLLAVAAGAAAQVAPAPILPNATVWIVESEFGHTLSAALMKKQVPVLITTNKEQADFFINETSHVDKEGAAERVAKVIGLGGLAGSGKSVEASVTVTNRDGMVVFARSAAKGNMKSAAEDFAKRLKNEIEKNAKVAKTAH